MSVSELFILNAQLFQHHLLKIPSFLHLVALESLLIDHVCEYLFFESLCSFDIWVYAFAPLLLIVLSSLK